MSTPVWPPWAIDETRAARFTALPSVEIADALTIGAATLATVPALLQGGMAERAAVVRGALEAGVIWTFEGSDYGIFDAAQMAPAVEAALGPEGYRTAHERGAIMSYDEAIDFLRAGLDALRDRTESPSD